MCARTIWQGLLPPDLRFDDFELTWAIASQAVGLLPAARIFSGPFQVPGAATLGLCLKPDFKVFRRKPANALSVAVMPSLSGGGAKDDRLQTLKSKLAQIYLEQGYSLNDVNRVTSALLQQVQHAKFQQVVEVRPPQELWQQLQALMQANHIKEPAAGEVNARIAHRVHAQVTKKGLFKDSLRAADFCLAGNFFVNQDGSPATILKVVTPQASGVILLDKDVAAGVIAGFTQKLPDEFGVVCLGH